MIIITIMNNGNKKTFNEDKILYLLTGSMLNMGIFYLPSAVGYYAKHDGWISVLIGGLYPLYMVFCASYLKKKHPNENILVLSNKYLSIYLGTPCNLLFMLSFIIFLASSASVTSNFIRTYTIGTIDNTIFILLFLLIGAFTAHKGINVIVKISELIFYLIIPFFFIAFNVFKFGSILNVLPIMNSSFTNILKGSSNALYAFGGIELIFLIYSDYKDEKRVMKYGIIATLIVILTYTGITFFISVYWENDVVQKSLWPSIYVIESIRNPIINSLRFILIYIWIIVTLKAISIYYYFCNRVLVHTFRRSKIKEYHLFIYIISVIIALNYKNEIVRRSVTNNMMFYLVLFNLTFITLITVFTVIKKDEQNEK